jgi:hypothetical protein
MNAEEPGPPPWPSAPPTEAIPWPVPERPSGWPTAIGVIAIVCGIGGIAVGLWAAVAPFFMRALLQNVPEQRSGLAVMDEWWPVSVALAIVGVGLAVLLLIGGVGVLRRGAWAPRACNTWAVLKVLLVIANAAVAYVVQKQTLMAMQGQNARMPPGWRAISGSMPGMTVCFALLWGWALPIFLLIWPARGTIKEEIAQWR